ncbi:SdrD B-like domain-containing protein [endosymbiont of Lamellibrachia barhami]|uniref:SdrD B-like domain-containing protein n=1 Tax=endosymbiont of Lamellibrachia barhami TaxID=205975 RepID=UPI0015B1ABBA|nr:SdrD B-like domain-containing protein [endosymbiont of Lamellibrachia barhami]
MHISTVDRPISMGRPKKNTLTKGMGLIAAMLMLFGINEAHATGPGLSAVIAMGCDSYTIGVKGDGDQTVTYTSSLESLSGGAPVALDGSFYMEPGPRSVLRTYTVTIDPPLTGSYQFNGAPGYEAGSATFSAYGEVINTLPITSSLPNLTLNCDIEPASIGDRVWYDDDGDGIQSGSEIDADDMVARLYDCDGNTLRDPFGNYYIDYTDINGNYLFDGLLPGCYHVKFYHNTTYNSLPDGYEFSPLDQGGSEALDNDAHSNGWTSAIQLASGEHNRDVDAGVYMPIVTTAKLGDRVFSDLDGDGIQDPNENGIENVQVVLYDCADDSQVATTSTDTSGMYLFDALAAGSYKVEFLSATGRFSPIDQGTDDTSDSDANPLNGMTQCVDLATGESNITIDAGIYETVSLGDYVWFDDNRNGVQEGTEYGVDDVTVTLTDCSIPPNSVLDSDGNVVVVTSTLNGAYQFDNLLPGCYVVTFDNLPTGFNFSPANSGGDDTIDSDANTATGRSHDVILESGDSDNTIDAGINYPPSARIGDRVFEDLNTNGIQDAGEPGIPGVPVELLDCNGTSVTTTVTGPDGNYLFTSLDAGGYVVRFTQMNGHFFTAANAGADDAVDSDADTTTGESACTTVAVDEVNLTIDAGMFRLASLGDYVWNDSNMDGVQDIGEAGIPNVRVSLTSDCNNDGSIDSVDETITDANGAYGFIALCPGSHTVDIDPATLPAGMIQSYDPDSVLDGMADTILISGGSDLTLDFGYYEDLPVVCSVCDGKVTELTLKYNGATAGYVEVSQKKGGIVFFGMVLPGETFSFSGTDKKGTLGTEITITVDGALDAKIHTSCSKPIGPGLIAGSFEVIEGVSRNGGNLCPVDGAPPPPATCDCDGKVVNLTLKYNGATPGYVEVSQKKGGIVFSGMVQPGEEFSFSGTDKKGTLGTEISITVDGSLDTKIHTSCSKPIGPGLIAGIFEVISGTSRNGGELCPVDGGTNPPPTPVDCGKCDGKVTELTLQYNGSATIDVTVVQKKDGDTVFSGTVAPGESFSFIGTDKKGTLSTEISLFVDGQLYTKIHTSCSQPIGPGMVLGDFTVASGKSRNGGVLPIYNSNTCPTQP